MQEKAEETCVDRKKQKVEEKVQVEGSRLVALKKTFGYFNYTNAADIAVNMQRS